MKKLLFLLLFPLLGFSQELFVEQKWKEDVSNMQVGDTITLQFQWVDPTDDVMDPKPTLVQFDWKYNKDLLQLIDHEFIVSSNPNASKNFNSWINYDFIPKDGYSQDDLSGQRILGLEYVNDNSFGINRVTIQDSDEVIGKTFEGDEILVEVRYQIKDVENTNFSDYQNITTLNWAHFRDNRDGEEYSVFADPLSLNLEDVGDIPAGTVTFQLQTPNAVNGSDYIIIIESLEQYQSQGNFDGQYEYVEGTFNTSGQFTTTELKQDVEYIFNVFIENGDDSETNTGTYPQWLDDVVTVSDVMQVFKQAIGTEPDSTGNHFQYNIQKQLANVKRNGPNDPIDFDDSYTLLAHIAGILDNSAGTYEPPAEGDEFYPITSFNNGAFNWSGWFDTFGVEINSEEEWLGQRTFTLSSDQAITFNVAHGLMGDADLSHSTTPNLNSDTEIQNRVVVSAGKGKRNILRAVAQEDRDLDITSQLIDGKVVLEIKLEKEDLAGMQFNINFDQTILNFEDITFDTGNELTNFAKKFENGRINFGAINIKDKNIKKGVPFKLIFTPKVSIQNTSGLISFRVTDAVKRDGTKVKLNLR